MTTPTPQDYALEPVAVVGSGFTLLWIGSSPIAPIVERHGLKVGSLLYAAPQSGWLPISEAPRDGTRVILAWSGRSITGFYLDNSISSKPWEGWRVESMVVRPPGQPTHFQLFPPPPSKEESTNG